MLNYLLLVVVPNLNYFFGALGLIGVGTCAAGFFSYLCLANDIYDEEDREKCSEFLKKLIPIFIVTVTMFFITCFIPTKKDLIQLKAISIISELKGADKIPQKIIDRLNNLLDAADVNQKGGL